VPVRFEARATPFTPSPYFHAQCRRTDWKEHLSHPRAEGAERVCPPPAAAPFPSESTDGAMWVDKARAGKVGGTPRGGRWEGKGRLSSCPPTFLASRSAAPSLRPPLPFKCSLGPRFSLSSSVWLGLPPSPFPDYCISPASPVHHHQTRPIDSKSHAQNLSSSSQSTTFPAPIHFVALSQATAVRFLRIGPRCQSSLSSRFQSLYPSLRRSFPRIPFSGPPEPPTDQPDPRPTQRVQRQKKDPRLVVPRNIRLLPSHRAHSSIVSSDPFD
jgi:hypothetical protein